MHTDAAIGYSLGESAALFALEVWPEQGEILARMQRTNLFYTDPAGSCHAVRRAWDIPGDGNLDCQVAVVNRPAGMVREVLGAFSHALKGISAVIDYRWCCGNIYSWFKRSMTVIFKSGLRSCI